MENAFSRKPGSSRAGYASRRSLVLAWVLCAWLASAARAQAPPSLEAAPLQPGLAGANENDGSPPLQKIQVAKPRPAQGPGSVGDFVESLRGNDAAFNVVVGQARILTVKRDITAGGRRQPLIAVADPSVVEFRVLSARQLRITGLRVGVTELSITTAENETYSFEIRVVADLSLLEGKLHEIYPDASIKLAQMREHVVVEGEARDQAQIARIVATIVSYLSSVTVGQSRVMAGMAAARQAGGLGAGAAGAAGQPTAPPAPPTPFAPGSDVAPTDAAAQTEGLVSPELGAGMAGMVSGALATPRVINLLRVPTSQQVMLKVRIAELNRTSLRQIGSNFLGVDPRTGGIVGSSIDGNLPFLGQIGQTGTLIPGNHLFGSAALGPVPSQTTVFGIFQHANFEFMLTALRKNGMLKILAEPNLVALNGQLASFLAGGEFPVPVPQVSAAGIAPTITVRFREFGVRLGFVPYILDGNVIRLTVAPEVSNIDFTIAVTLVAGGSPVPGLNTRKAQTTVEMREGQTLAMAGLLQLTLDGNTTRIPGLGDLPILGPLFSNTTNERIEKELVVLVTPYLVEPMRHEQVPPTPGDEVKGPNDLEFYFLNRIEGRTGKDHRATTNWDDPLNLRYHLNLERKYVQGPVGFSE
jgi:pilus assembly protein CpaC